VIDRSVSSRRAICGNPAVANSAQRRLPLPRQEAIRSHLPWPIVMKVVTGPLPVLGTISPLSPQMV
jgi:hypothetical protein